MKNGHYFGVLCVILKINALEDAEIVAGVICGLNTRTSEHTNILQMLQLRYRNPCEATSTEIALNFCPFYIPVVNLRLPKRLATRQRLLLTCYCVQDRRALVAWRTSFRRRICFVSSPSLGISRIRTSCPQCMAP